MLLTTKGRQALKARAHKLKPVVLIGSQGLTEAVLNEIDRALNDHELIKVRIAGNDREERRAMITAMCEAKSAELVQIIGHIAVLFRRKAD